MKKINIIFKLLLAIMLLPIIAACDNDNGEKDAMFIGPFEFMVKFESPLGTNILDSLQVPHMRNSVRSNHLDDLTLEWSNKNNNLNQPWRIPYLAWAHTTEEWASFNPYFSFKGVGSILNVGLTDLSIWDTPNNKYPKRDEEYTISLTSKKIFGDETPHYIKFYIHIKGKAVYDTYKCEVDGKEQPLIWRYYNPDNLPENKDLTGAFIVIKTK